MHGRRRVGFRVLGLFRLKGFGRARTVDVMSHVYVCIYIYVFLYASADSAGKPAPAIILRDYSHVIMHRTLT